MPHTASSKSPKGIMIKKLPTSGIDFESKDWTQTDVWLLRLIEKLNEVVEELNRLIPKG